MNKTLWSEVIELKAEHVFRFSCHSETLILMVKGEAEIYGTEFPLNNPVKFPKDYKGSLITYSGCDVRFMGCNFSYFILTFIEDHNCWNIYLNIHSSLEVKRKNASDDKGGPRVMVCGQSNSGKKRLSQILMNYMVRSFGKGLLVDANVNLNHIALPGSIAAMVITQPYDIIDGWYIYDEPIIFTFGHLTPLDDPELYMLQLKTLSDFVEERLENDPELRQTGFILNMSSMEGEPDSSEDQRAALFLETIELFQINYIIIVGDGFLERNLKKITESNVRVIKIPKSSEIENRDDAKLVELYHFKASSYFKGQGNYQLRLKGYRLVTRSTKIFRFEPTTSENNDRLEKPQIMKISKQFMNSFLAISQTSEVNEIATTPIYGYVMVTEVSRDLSSFKVITPSGDPIPSKIFIYSEFKMHF